MAGTLHVVATPIGNLEDITFRALRVLREVAVVAAEDTRRSGQLLRHFGIATRLVSLHSHNEGLKAEGLVDRLRRGESIALVSDAGTPAVSDPGALLVAAAHREGIRVVPVPGPNAAIAAWSASGFVADRFLYVGFLPAKPAKSLAALDDALPLIFYEAPHRVAATVAALLERFGPERELVVARELTKKFEEIARMSLRDGPAWLEAGPHRQQGEFVLVLGPGEAKQAASAFDPGKVLDLLLEALPASEAAKLAARITGAPRNALYKEALARNSPGSKAK